MRQPELQTTAPLDPDPTWPDGYVEVLRQEGAHEKTIPYCVSWVRRFFSHYPDRPRRELGRNEIEAFLSELVHRPGVSNWMVQQARNAIETYYESFRGIPLAPRTEAVGTSPSAPPRSPLDIGTPASATSSLVPIRYPMAERTVKRIPVPVSAPESSREAA